MEAYFSFGLGFQKNVNIRYKDVKRFDRVRFFVPRN